MSSFTLYLIKEDFIPAERYFLEGDDVKERLNSIFNDGVTLSEDPRIEEYILRNDLNHRLIKQSNSPHTVFYRETNSLNPWWKDYWLVPEQLESKSADILILLEVNNRIVIVTHGHSRHLINPLSIEFDFGLKTALNLIDEKHIKSADLFTPSEVGMRTKKQTGRTTKIEEYDINIFNTLLKDVAGKVTKEYEDYFKSIEGSDSIKFNFSGNSDELLELVEELLSIYSSEDYKEKGFEWIDNFRNVKDKGLIEILDQLLVDKINEYSTGVSLFYPNINDYSVNIHFKYKGFRHPSEYPFLDIEDQYYSQLRKQDIVIKVDDLKRHTIAAINKDDNFIITILKVYQCLYSEIEYEDNTYFIESGTWYKVDRSFLEQIDEKIEELILDNWDCGLTYNKYQITQEAGRTKKSNEYIFNSQLTEHLSGKSEAELLDFKLVNLSKSKIEICDVLYKEDESNIYLIHNKRNYGSSALSHLFSQGLVSAELIIENGFRKLANEKIENNNLKFPESGHLSRNDYIIIYGIISKKNRNGEFSIPLFSKINLEQFYRNLIRLDYRVRLCFIEMV